MAVKTVPVIAVLRHGNVRVHELGLGRLGTSTAGGSTAGQQRQLSSGGGGGGGGSGQQQQPGLPALCAFHEAHESEVLKDTAFVDETVPFLAVLSILTAFVAETAPFLAVLRCWPWPSGSRRGTTLKSRQGWCWRRPRETG